MASQYAIRTFETGATRDTAQDKLDYEGFLSPLVLQRYAQYMHKNRLQPDGALRDSDNWQLGIPIPQYMKSLWRHFMEVWGLHRGVATGDITEALCAVIFNAMGYLHEVLKKQLLQTPDVSATPATPIHIEEPPTGTRRAVSNLPYDPATLKMTFAPSSSNTPTSITPL